MSFEDDSIVRIDADTIITVRTDGFQGPPGPSGGGTDLIAGDGIVIDGDEIRVSTDVSRTDHTHSLSTSSITGVLPLTKGGTGVNLTTVAAHQIPFMNDAATGLAVSGSLLYDSTTFTLSVPAGLFTTDIGIGSGNNAFFLFPPNAASSAQFWRLPSTATTGAVLSVGAVSSGITNLVWATPGTGGVGTVTSVAFSAPNIFTVSGSPITSSGTLGLTLVSQTTSSVFAAPSGGAGAPSFRQLSHLELQDVSGDVHPRYLDCTPNTTNRNIIQSSSETIDGVVIREPVAGVTTSTPGQFLVQKANGTNVIGVIWAGLAGQTQPLLHTLVRPRFAGTAVDNEPFLRGDIIPSNRGGTGTGTYTYTPLTDTYALPFVNENRIYNTFSNFVLDGATSAFHITGVTVDIDGQPVVVTNDARLPPATGTDGSYLSKISSGVQWAIDHLIKGPATSARNLIQAIANNAIGLEVRSRAGGSYTASAVTWSTSDAVAQFYTTDSGFSSTPRVGFRNRPCVANDAASQTINNQIALLGDFANPSVTSITFPNSISLTNVNTDEFRINSSLFRIEMLMSSAWPFGAIIQCKNTAGTLQNIRFDSPVIINADSYLNFTGNSQHKMGLTTTGFDTLQIGVSADTSAAGMALVLCRYDHMGTANRSVQSQHTNPTFYVFSANNSSTIQYVRLSHDQTNALIDVGSGMLSTNADLAVSTIGKGLRVKEGTNAKQGVATLSAGTVTVNNTSVTANSRIMLTAQDNNTIGALRVSSRTAGTSFLIVSTMMTDSGVVAYQIFEPA